MARGWWVRVVIGTVLTGLLLGASTAIPTTAGAIPVPKVPTLAANRAVHSLPRGYVGLTFEATTLNQPYLDPSQSNLPIFLGALGQGNLRFGGQTSDLNAVYQPTPAPLPGWANFAVTPGDLSTVADLAHVSGWSVDLGVNLLEYAPALAANEVATAQAALGSSLHGVEIGNEPDLYFYFRSFLTEPPANIPITFPTWLTEWQAYAAQIQQADPGVALAGPDFYLNTWQSSYTKKTEQGLSEYTQHFYPQLDCGGAVLSPQTLMSADSLTNEDTAVALATKTAKKGKLPVVLDEFNSISCGSSSPAAWEFASALWGVEALLEGAQDGVSSVNMQSTPGDCTSYTPLCVPDPSHPAALSANPIFSAMELVSSLEGGTMLATAVKKVPLPAGVTTYAVLQPDGDTAFVVDNTTATDVDSLSLQGSTTSQLVSVERLEAPALDATTGVTLSSSTPTSPALSGLSVPAYSAAVFTVTP
jgi:hypothetical protein